jgi:hypothetical protein
MNRPGKAFASARKRRIEWIFWKDFVGLEMSANYKTAQTSLTIQAAVAGINRTIERRLC